MNKDKENFRSSMCHKKVFDYLRTKDEKMIPIYLGDIREDLAGFSLDELWKYMVAHNYYHEKYVWIIEGGIA